MIYTENYQLRKPVIGVDDADVKDLNFNSDRIDAIMHSSQISLADAYDLNSTYNTGDVVMYEFLMYRCLEDNVTGVWNPEKWTRTTAGEESGGGADLDIYGEASGTAEASFSDGAEASLVECEIGIVPTQDLHGYSKPWAGGAGKNKLDKDEISNVNTSFQSKQITLSPNTEYTISTTLPKNNSNSANLFMYLVGGSPDTSVNGVWAGQTRTITTDGTGIVVIGYRSVDYTDTSSTWYLSHDMQIEQGSQATTFEPYSNICPISGHTDVTVTVASTSGDDTTVSLGRTVYGGTLDVTTGELTVDRAYVDVGTLNWTYSTADTRFYTTNLTDVKKVTDTSIVMNGLCSHYDIVAYRYVNSTSALDSVMGLYSTSTANYLAIKDTRYTDATTFTQAVNGVQLVYELATPQTFNLTPTQVLTLLGQNYVSHDGGGTISLVYIKKDSTIIPNPSDAEVPLTGLEISGKGFKITDARIPAPPTTNGAYVLTVTVSGGTPTYSWENA